MKAEALVSSSNLPWIAADSRVKNWTRFYVCNSKAHVLSTEQYGLKVLQ